MVILAASSAGNRSPAQSTFTPIPTPPADRGPETFPLTEDTGRAWDVGPVVGRTRSFGLFRAIVPSARAYASPASAIASETAAASRQASVGSRARSAGTRG